MNSHTMDSQRRMLRYAVWSGLLFFPLVAATLPALAQQSSGEQKGEEAAVVAASAAANTNAELPDSPGVTAAKTSQTTKQSTSEQSAPTATWNIAALASPEGSSPGGQPQNINTQNAAQDTQTQTPQRPVGTAAAEAPKSTGVAASQPAGVAIAPAKQHRMRTIVIRTGAIIAAGVAVGSVIALTAATGPKPPGAH
jgi:hypothetical protein